VTSTGAGDDTMEVEALGDTADRHGDDADAGAHMDCDDDGEEGGVPWVTVPQALVQPSEGEPSGPPLPKNKRSHRSSGSKKGSKNAGGSPEKRAKLKDNHHRHRAQLKELDYLSKK